MSVAQIASWSPVTTTAFIWAPPESFVDTLPAFSLMLRRCPATYNEHHMSPRPHQPLLGWYECRLYSPRRAGRERGERAAYAGSDPAAASLCPIRRVLFAARVLGEISACMAYPTTLALIAALWSGPGRYSRGLSASGAASPACIGCRCCPRLTASTMILAPRPTITMPAII